MLDDDALVRARRAIPGANGAIGAAQNSLVGLRAAALEADETLGRKVNSARGLADELSLLNSAGERIANRMETARLARAETAPRALPVFSDNFLNPSTTSSLILAGTLLPGTDYVYELDFSNRLDGFDFVNNTFTTQGFDLRTDGAFTTGAETPLPPAWPQGQVLQRSQ